MEFVYRSLSAILAAICMGHGLQRLFPAQAKRWKRLALCGLLYLTFTLPCWIGDENPLFMFPFFMLGFFVLLSGERLFRLTTGGIFYALFISLNALFDSLFRKEAVFVVFLLIKMLLWCALACFLVRVAPKGGLQLSKKLGLLLGALTLAPLVATLSFSIWGYRWVSSVAFAQYSAMLQRLAFTILPFVLFSALALLIAAVVLSRHEALEQENKLAALREVYYSGLKQEQTGLRTLRHDLRNHVAAMQGLLEQGKRGEVVEYLTQLAESPALDSGKRYTANEAANVVLSSKATQMEGKGLRPDFAVALPVRLSLPASELCALLGNALDNAIEGSDGAEDKTITLRARLEKGVFMLQVQNAVGATVHPDLSTTKADHARHGFGLTGMREIAQRYGGSLEAAAKDGRFALLVCFPCKEQEASGG